jgi:hypothetical protein
LAGLQGVGDLGQRPAPGKGVADNLRERSRDAIDLRIGGGERFSLREGME